MKIGALVAIGTLLLGVYWLMNHSECAGAIMSMSLGELVRVCR